MPKKKVPSYEACLALMRKSDPLLAEDGFHWLLPRAELHAEKLIESFKIEEDHGIRCWLLELIGEARSDKAFSVLSEQALSSDESLSSWGKRGLRLLNTKEARTFLFQNEIVEERL